MARSPAAMPARDDGRESGGYKLALVLAALAGSVDAVGFVHWHGLFVSFMSGNSTILGAASARLDARAAVVSLAVLAAFVAGVVAGELLAAATRRYARAAILLLEAALLGAGAWLACFDVAEYLVAPLLGVAMGVQNASVHRAGGIALALTYVTGTLVQIGRRLAAASRGVGAWSDVLPFLGLWCALVGGSAAGALATFRSEWEALAGAATIALVLSLAISVRAWNRASRSGDAVATSA